MIIIITKQYLKSRLSSFGLEPPALIIKSKDLKAFWIIYHGV